MVIGGFLEARSLTKTPKVVTHGSKPCHVFPEWPNKTTPIVLVEDGISALKVSYVNPCGALFGSSLSPEWIKNILHGKYKIVIWLDKDKIRVAREMRDKLIAQGISATVIFTPKDPKYYYKYEIWDLIKKATSTFPGSIPLNPEELVERWNPMNSRLEMVPTKSVRANLWPTTIPDYIPKEELPVGFCWRYDKPSESWIKPLIGSGRYRQMRCDPYGLSHTRWSNMDICNEMDAEDYLTMENLKNPNTPINPSGKIKYDYDSAPYVWAPDPPQGLQPSYGLSGVTITQSLQHTDSLMNYLNMKKKKTIKIVP